MGELFCDKISIPPWKIEVNCNIDSVNAPALPS